MIKSSSQIQLPRKSGETERALSFCVRVSGVGFHFTIFFKVVLQKSIPTQIRQHIPYISNSQAYVDGFVGESTSAKRLHKHFVRDKASGLGTPGARGALSDHELSRTMQQGPGRAHLSE